MHPFRFAIQQGSPQSGQKWAALARRAEELGYDVLVVPDHLNKQLSPFTALAMAAAATTKLRVGAFVFANDYRHPLMLARELATLDLLSDGRCEVGIGAGWMPTDYQELGMAYDLPPRRIDRLEEAVPLIKRLLTGETITHKGEHYQLDRASVGVETVQKPRPPLAIGAGGPRMLKIAAREADIIGLTPGFNARGWPIFGQATETATEAKVALIREVAGERFERLELNLWVSSAGLVGSGNSLLGTATAAAAKAATSVYGSPYVLYGTVRGVRDQLMRRRDKLGISNYAFPSRSMEVMAPLVEALAGK
jgi:probable F420-dependent oxidoreductase